ncbi:L-rhamnose/proton symporter RhaT [Piscirickettsia litoralis]|uniref:EamA domain-containing protein n=1 Tax=Piscirickettsia litoralis TaxID=1891921 RepID=A0ABX2ZXC3_9GAMM|nr:L-rhamnose/proton symporter RhaT [Piscirickettsia litoralis]ODN41207.1 hypothetical protein BGC07_17490 [Piscirickettsia litoralis]
MSIFALFISIFAGLANGSYIYPIENNQKDINLVWIRFAAITFLAIPSLIFIYSTLSGSFYLTLKHSLIILLVGIFFGIGMFVFTKSVRYIGLGVPFAINISLGTLSGSLFSIFINGKYYLFSEDKLITLSYAIFIIAIALYAYSLSIRDSQKNINWVKGLSLALASGILCASQGAAIGYYSDYLKSYPNHFTSLLIPWSLIFISCGIVFILSQIKDAKNNKVKIDYFSKDKKSVKVAGIMSAMYFGSVVLYNWANAMTLKFSEEFLWISFMSCIVIASTVCSYVKGEWINSSKKGMVINYTAIFMLIFSIILFGIASTN